ncbi:MAG: VWA domain-containing protein, partial [Nocardioides sp.]
GRRGLVIAVVVAAVGGALLSRQLLSSASDQADTPVCLATPATLVTSANLARPLRKALQADACPRIEVTVRTPAALLDAFKDNEKAPDYWIPDSTLWLDRLAAEADTRPDVVVESVAETPIVLAAKGKPSDDWAEAMSSPGYVLGDPARDTTAFASIALTTAGKSTRELIAALAPLALRADVQSYPTAVSARIAAIERSTDGSGAISEQALLASGATLTASVPEPGTWMMTYPLAQTAAPDRREELAGSTELLASLVRSPRFHDALTSESFRVPEADPPPKGVGKVRVVEPPSAEAISTLLARWQRLSLPNQILAVIDVSGSMDFASRGGSRIDLTVGATEAGLKLFSETSSVGLWAFSQRDEGQLGENRDYLELVMQRPLNQTVGTTAQRALLARELSRLPRLTGGGTALYDTAIAAYRQALEDYNPEAINGVVIFSDGRNEDPDSPDLETTVKKLRALADAERPVLLIAIGISQDADAQSLDRLAKATGGFSLVARRPKDIGKVFLQAMANRIA